MVSHVVLQVSVAIWIVHASAVDVKNIVLVLVEMVMRSKPSIEIMVIIGRTVDVDVFPLNPFESHGRYFNLLPFKAPWFIIGPFATDNALNGVESFFRPSAFSLDPSLSVLAEIK